jgi:hypothetical protein
MWRATVTDRNGFAPCQSAACFITGPPLDAIGGIATHARDRQLLMRLSRAASERIQDSYQGTEMAARVCALYEEVLVEQGRF